MKKTFKKLREIDFVIGELYRANDSLRNTKFGYAYKRFVEKNYKPLFSELQEKVSIIRIDNALEDEKTKEILIDNNPLSRGYKYSREGLKKCIEQENKIVKEYDVKEVDVEPFISSFVPKLTEEQEDTLKGFLIK
ncbi:MAG: hypothetical protein AABY22_21855 [Nanoarchaeota archaeon]